MSFSSFFGFGDTTPQRGYRIIDQTNQATPKTKNLQAPNKVVLFSGTPVTPPQNKPSLWEMIKTASVLYSTKRLVVDPLTHNLRTFTDWVQFNGMGTADHRMKIREARKNLVFQATAIDLCIKHHINPTRIMLYWSGKLDENELFVQEQAVITEAIRTAPLKARL